MWPSPLDNLLLGNLQQTFPLDSAGYIAKQETHQLLILCTEQNFGYDVAAWKCWFAEHDPRTAWCRLIKNFPYIVEVAQKNGVAKQALSTMLQG